MALEEYNRFSDQDRIARDANLEITEAFFPPYFESLQLLDIGDNDPAKVGAIATFIDGNKTNLAIYQGGGVWAVSGGSTSYISDESITMDTTSAYLNSTYPDMPMGGGVYNETQGIQFTKITSTKWKFEIIDLR
ncbi:hypothetical protein ACR79B_04955 [Sphingobacterium spiritivorum]|uniref:hypothetical protein n=1 Tax=Sphingobacterium spiritivorum TaxID=258 RepID=UPI003DA55D38